MTVAAILAIMSICSRHNIDGVYERGFEKCAVVIVHRNNPSETDLRLALDIAAADRDSIEHHEQ